MFRLREHRPAPQRLSDWLPWALLVAPGVLMHKTGALQRCWDMQGHDLASSGSAELAHTAAQLSGALQRLGSDWGVHVEARRAPITPPPHAPSGPPVVRLLSGERHARLAASRGLYATHTTLTLTYQPPRQDTKRSWFERLFEGEQATSQATADALDERISAFDAQCRQFTALLGPALRRLTPLDDAQLLTYLHSTISTREQPVGVPPTPMYLDELLCDEAISVGTTMRLGAAHVRVLGVKGWPAVTWPAFLQDLDALGVSYRWVLRWLALSTADAVGELRRYERQLFGQRERLGVASLSGQQSPLQNQAALRATGAVSGVLADVESEQVGAGRMTMTLVLMDEDHGALERHTRAVEELLARRGLLTVREDTGLLGAWLGALPGHLYANPRRALMTTADAAHILPTHHAWSGSPTNTHLGTPAHLLCATAGTTPFFLNLNVGDVGHTLVLGPTGAGKSTLLGTLALMWLAQPDAQVITFDKGRSSRAACLAAGGDFLELSVSRPEHTFAPLARLDEPGELEFVRQWLIDVIEGEGVHLDVARRSLLTRALEQLIALPAPARSLGALRTYIQHHELKGALAPFCRGGVHGELFDSPVEHLDGDAGWLALEMGELMEAGASVTSAALAYLFRRVAARFDGRPTLLILDEAWAYLDNPVFSARLRQWLKELRKLQVYVVFATQSIADALGSTIAPTLLESCPTRLLLPNVHAEQDAVRHYYERLGLSAQQLRLLASATPKRHYYYTSPLGDRLFELGLSPLELALVGASSPQDHARMDQASALVEERGGSWAAIFLYLAGFEGAARSLSTGAIP